MKINLGKLLGGVGKTLVTLAITAAAQALTDAATKRLSREDRPKTGA